MSTQKLFTLLFIASLWISLPVFADIQLFDSNYKAELYASYTSYAFTGHMIFDSAGNMYVTNRDSGSITKIGTDGSASTWSSGFGNAVDIVETTGSSYGDGFIVSDYSSGKLYKVDSSGNKTLFTSLSTAGALAIDKKGTYGGGLFAISRGSDSIYQIGTSGQKTVFSSPYSSSEFDLLGLNFDPGSRFGGKMYLGMWGSNKGIYSVGTNGSTTKFSVGLTSSGALEFDHVNGFFGGDMFALGKKGSYDGIYELYRFSPDGSSTLFMKDSNPILGVGAFTFGPDGAMYAAVGNPGSGVTDIYRIVPEPATICVLGFGCCLSALKRKSKI